MEKFLGKPGIPDVVAQLCPQSRKDMKQLLGWAERTNLQATGELLEIPGNDEQFSFRMMFRCPNAGVMTSVNLLPDEWLVFHSDTGSVTVHTSNQFKKYWRSEDETLPD